MRRFILILSLFTISSMIANPGYAQFDNGSTIVFFGDSITRQGDQPGGYVDLIRKQLLRPESNYSIQVIGAGVGGNRVPDLLARVEKDVLAHDPTHVVVYIGINDVWHSQKGRGTPKDEYEAGLKKLIDQLKSAGSKVWLCTPSVIGEKTDGSNDLDEMLDEFCDISRRVAAEMDVPVIDLRRAFLNRLKQTNPDNRSKGILTGDGVHLNQAGNELVAETMLSALRPEKNDDSGHPIRHIVLFKFVDDASPEEVKTIVDAFAKLPDKIDEIADFEMGTNNSPENLDQGFTHCFMVTFNNEADRDAYLPHPAHQEFVKLLEGKIDKVLVFDYRN